MTVEKLRLTIQSALQSIVGMRIRDSVNDSIENTVKAITIDGKMLTHLFIVHDLQLFLNLPEFPLSPKSIIRLGVKSTDMGEYKVIDLVNVNICEPKIEDVELEHLVDVLTYRVAKEKLEDSKKELRLIERNKEMLEQQIKQLNSIIEYYH